MARWYIPAQLMMIFTDEPELIRIDSGYLRIVSGYLRIVSFFYVLDPQARKYDWLKI